MFNTEIILPETDKKTIENIVHNFAPGDRVKALRAIFKTRCNTAHFFYLGEVTGKEKEKHLNFVLSNVVDRMQVLSYLN